MKHIKSRIAAILFAATTTICAAQAVSASAFSAPTMSSVGQSLAWNFTTGYPQWFVEQNTNSQYNYGLKPGKYWNGSNAYSCTSNPNAAANSMEAGLMTGVHYSYNYPAQSSAPLTGSKGFARALAAMYFQTNAYMRGGVDMNFAPKFGDQIMLRKYVNGSYQDYRAIFIYGMDNHYNYLYAYCDQNDHNKIHWDGVGAMHNGTWLDGASQTICNIQYVDRPILMGDVTGDGRVDDDDFNTVRDYLGGEFIDYTGTVNAAFVNAVADTNGDGEINWTDYAAIAQNENGLLKNNVRNGFLVSF